MSIVLGWLLFTAKAQTPFADIIPEFPISSGANGAVNWNAAGTYQSGHATHYGPFPSNPSASEAGYQPLDVGVGCSDGQPGGDPRWKAILERGTKPNPIMNSTVWPIQATVAVSEFAWGFKNKDQVCFKPIQIRNKKNPTQTISAIIVDFCPAAGCLWPSEQRPFNVDVYGEDTWFKLGGGKTDAMLDVEIQWPAGLVPNSQLNLIPFLGILVFLFN